MRVQSQLLGNAQEYFVESNKTEDLALDHECELFRSDSCNVVEGFDD